MVDFAEDGNYPAGGDVWSGQPRIVTLTDSERAAGFTPGQPVPAEIQNGLFNGLDLAMRPVAGRYTLDVGITTAGNDIPTTPEFQVGGLSKTLGLINVTYAGYYAVSLYAEIKHASTSTDFPAGIGLYKTNAPSFVSFAKSVRYSGSAGQVFSIHGSSIHYFDASEHIYLRGRSGGEASSISDIEVMYGYVTVHRIPFRLGT